MVYYVKSGTGREGDGSGQHPFSKIQQAADIAQAGDEVIVYPGIYRERNHIHHCTRGMWLDWQAQETRVTCNLMHDNTRLYDYFDE